MTDGNTYSKIVIRYCAKCKWQNRAIWYLTEILQTFPEIINDISIQPIFDKPGIFEIILIKDINEPSRIIYKRKFKNPALSRKYAEEFGESGDQDEDYYFDGFPDSKFLKLIIKDVLDEGKDDNDDKVGVKLGNHLTRGGKQDPLNFLTTEKKPISAPTTVDSNIDCQDCKIEQ
ncbi:Rdx family-domain-containing protein [Scheffersomyces coipomensis]|uniref:Rdx family-domain-containing protein n=1 Tax=Scheffersomyces coipomensis TaxID=1788519 RepID=UPI00315CB283